MRPADMMTAGWVSIPERFRLHIAASLGDNAEIKQCLELGDNIDWPCAALGNRTALICAVDASQVDAVRFLLDAGANPCICEEAGYFPLYLAATADDLEMTKLLIAAKADVNAILTYNGDRTALVGAAFRGFKAIVQVLIKAGADVEKSTPDGHNALISAAQGGYLEIVDMLLDSGARISAYGYEGFTALCAASSAGELNAVVHLIKRGADVDQMGLNGSCPLHYGAAMGHVEIVDVLIRAGANVNVNPSEKGGGTPLHFTAHNGCCKCARLLIYAGANVSARDHKQWTPLHYASFQGNNEMIELLLSAGTDINASDNQDHTPIFVAAMQGQTEAITLLIEAGNDPHKLNTIGTSILAGVPNFKTVKLLLNLGLSATHVDECGRSVLHYCGANGSDTASICALYKAGADPCLVDNSGMTAADHARERGHSDAVKLLELLAAKHRALNPTNAGGRVERSGSA